MSVWTVYTDGASRGNPGAAAFSYVITRPGESPIEHAERMADSTNNQAEYTALVAALRKAVALKTTAKIAIHSDSELMVKQMKGEYRVKDAGLKSLYDEAMKLAAQLTGGVTYTHVRREKNKRADELCNLVLDGKWIAEEDPSESPMTLASSPATAPPLSRLDREAVTILRQALQPGGTPPTPETLWQHLRILLDQHGINLEESR